MAQRIYREQPQSVKDKISQSMKQYHATKSVDDARKCRERQAAAMRQYWATIPSHTDTDGNQGEASLI